MVGRGRVNDPTLEGSSSPEWIEWKRRDHHRSYLEYTSVIYRLLSTYLVQLSLTSLPRYWKQFFIEDFYPFTVKGISVMPYIETSTCLMFWTEMGTGRDIELVQNIENSESKESTLYSCYGCSVLTTLLVYSVCVRFTRSGQGPCVSLESCHFVKELSFFTPYS